MAVMELKHPCQPHPFQDKKYGKTKRVFTQTKKSEGTIFNCTVCGKEQSKK